MAGLYHVTSPNPVTNAEMMATYRKLLGRRFGLPAPTPITVVGAILLGSDPRWPSPAAAAFPTRLLDEGFEFSVPTFDEAAAKALASGSPAVRGEERSVPRASHERSETGP
ncbi:MAG: hypothetical protein KY431_01845 [Actinobacteria bacterium]|nr:hypothetical protein [Actinomycetota bacterium]